MMAFIPKSKSKTVIPSLIGGMELLCFGLTKPTTENGNARMSLVVAVKEED